jgi:hypothetical protein
MAGRPTKYRKKFCDELVDHMSNGYSFDSFAGTIKVSAMVLYDWCKAHTEFADAKALGTTMRNSLVEQRFVDAALNGTDCPNPALLRLLLCNVLKKDYQSESAINADTSAKQPTNINISFSEATPENIDES